MLPGHFSSVGCFASAVAENVHIDLCTEKGHAIFSSFFFLMKIHSLIDLFILLAIYVLLCNNWDW